MLSRAHLLIERDYERLQKEPIWGIEAHPLKDDNVFEWTGRVMGLKGTVWEGGIFRLYIKFDEHYNMRPPDVCFHTIPFHPNVDMVTGKPCIDILDEWDQWKEKYSLPLILLCVQTLLSNPVLENAVNPDAAGLLAHSPHSYRQMVLDCVTASQRVEAGLNPHFMEEKVRFAPTQAPSPKPATPSALPPRAARVSFEEYHTTWSGIATSKSNPNMKNPLLETIKDKPSLQAAHYGLPLEELQNQVDRQLQEHNSLVYGRFKTKLTEEEEKAAKMDKVNKMRKIYLQPRKTPTTIPTPSMFSPSMPGNLRPEADPWEQEVDELVAWTTKLDEDMI